MSRLIDADELIKQIQTTYCKDCKYCNKDKEFFHCLIEQIIGDIHYAPTVDLWHYPSKGELPDKDVECLVRTTSGNNFIAMIDSSDNCWCTGEFFSESLRDDCVECWQYITPPKEEA